MIRWSRARLALSILTAEGFWATLRERFQYAPGRAIKTAPGAPREDGMPSLPMYYDYAGAAHVHSTYSDGTGTVPDIAAAAARAGIDFVLLTDHRSLAARCEGHETWHENGRVLMVLGTEVTTDNGHLLALDIPHEFLPSPNSAEAAMRRIHELGGYGFIALPCDLKDAWKDFSVREPGIGIEVFNLSAIARTKLNIPALLLAFARYRGGKPIQAFSYVTARPTRELKLWDALLEQSAERQEPLPLALGSVDAHAVMRLGARSYPFPTYEEVFRTLRTHILTSEPLSGSQESAKADLALVHQALRSGHAYISFDNYADPTGFLFEACKDSEHVATMGDTLHHGLAHDRPLVLRARAPRSRSIIRLYRNGSLVASSRGGSLTYQVVEPGIYRAEAYLYRRRVGQLCLGAQPWIFSNPLLVLSAPGPDRGAVGAGVAQGKSQSR